MQSRQGVVHFRIKGKRNKIRFVPIPPVVSRLSVSDPQGLIGEVSKEDALA